jgi:hypothetical protein
MKQGGQHEPFSYSDVCWRNNYCSGLNIGIGMALPRQKSQRSIGHGLWRHPGKSSVNLIAPVYTPRRWNWLHDRLVPAVLGLTEATLC